MTSLFKKPDVAEVHAFLDGKNSLIVHFSGAPKGAGKDRGLLYPQDLRHVVAGNARGGISCSTVQPGDAFSGVNRNATGCIGVIVDLQEPSSLVAVHPHDCGSIEEADGTRSVPNEGDITLADLENSTQDRRSTLYNEWVVRNYIVHGILAVPPFEISVLAVPDFPPEMPEYMRDNTPIPDIDRISIQRVIAEFPGMPVYTMHNADVILVSGDKPVAVPITSIYCLRT